MKRIDENKDLSGMNDREVVKHSRQVAGLSNDQMARGMGIGEETVARYQRDPNPGEYEYGLQIRRVKVWNRTAGNDIVIRWLCQECGGMFVRTDYRDNSDMDIVGQMALVSKESQAAIGSLLEGMQDGTLNDDEIRNIIAHLRENARVSTEAVLRAESRIKKCEK